MPKSDPGRVPATKRVLVADPIHEQGKALLVSTPGLVVEVATGLDETALCQRIGDYDALIVRSGPHDGLSEARDAVDGDTFRIDTLVGFEVVLDTAHAPGPR